MKCPYCGAEMPTGFIHCHNGLYNITWKAYDKSLKKIVVPSDEAFWFNKIEQVSFCPACNVLIKRLE